METNIPPEIEKILPNKEVVYEYTLLCESILVISGNQARLKPEVIYDPETSIPTISIGVSMPTLEEGERVINTTHHIWWKALSPEAKELIGIELTDCY